MHGEWRLGRQVWSPVCTGYMAPGLQHTIMLLFHCFYLHAHADTRCHNLVACACNRAAGQKHLATVRRSTAATFGLAAGHWWPPVVASQLISAWLLCSVCIPH